MGRSKVLFIGLDSAPPKLLYEEFRGELDGVPSLVDEGARWVLESCHPPITIPAWAVMMTSKDPGELGIYGFRHRRRGSYTDVYIVNSRHVKEPALWDVIAGKGMRSCLIGVPPSYPPKPIKGWLVSCFITPDSRRAYTHPVGLKREVERLVGEYMFDVEFRTEQRERLVEELWEMTKRRFRVAEHLLVKKNWDYFMMVEIGVDRVHHAFWKFFDKEHHLYSPGSKFENVIRDYYKLVDGLVARLVKLAGRDVVTVVASDHGAKRMKGAFCINQWLAEKGYLKMKKPGRVVDLEEAEVDWGRSVAWGWGGYYARVFINVEGREPRGLVKQSDYESVRNELADELRRVEDPDGRRMDTKVYKPDEIYSKLRGDPPDLMVYFDDLYWRSAGTVGHKSMYLPENDKGPDDAVHDYYGVFVVHDPEGRVGRREGGLINILDVAPTLLELMGVEKPGFMRGRPRASFR